MNITKSLLATAALAASFSASAGAQATWSLGTLAGPLLALSGGPAQTFCTAESPCTLGPGVATIVGGATYDLTEPTFAARPAGTSLGGRFLAAGPASGSSNQATMSFTSGISSISFRWGSPDTYNFLDVVTSDGTKTFSHVDFPFAPNPNQSFSELVTFTADDNETISALIFRSTSNAFEVSDFRIEAAGSSQVPEPASFALAAAGLLGLLGVARRRSVNSI